MICLLLALLNHILNVSPEVPTLNKRVCHEEHNVGSKLRPQVRPFIQAHNVVGHVVVIVVVNLSKGIALHSNRIRVVKKQKIQRFLGDCVQSHVLCSTLFDCSHA